MAVGSSDDWRTRLRRCSISWAPIRKRYETGIATPCSASLISFRVRSLPDWPPRWRIAGNSHGYIMRAGVRMRFEEFSFGSIRIDGTTHEYDVVVDRGQVRKRKKKPIQKVSRGLWAHSGFDRGSH